MRTKRQAEEHQGRLSNIESQFSIRMLASPKRYFTSLDICSILKCVSARDKIRKLQANGVPIGPAKFMHTTKTGSRVYGWRIEK